MNRIAQRFKCRFNHKMTLNKQGVTEYDVTELARLEAAILRATFQSKTNGLGLAEVYRAVSSLSNCDDSIKWHALRRLVEAGLVEDKNQNCGHYRITQWGKVIYHMGYVRHLEYG